MKCRGKILKVILAALLVIAMCAACACSEEERYLTGVNKATQQKTTARRDDRVTIYTYVNPDSETQIYDNDSKFYYPLIAMAHMYNNYCSNNMEGENAVSIIKFSSRDRMVQQMSTEIMAGGGPDIIVLDNELPVSKLISQGAFQDLDEYIENDNSKNALNLDNYNEELLNTGVFNGKRYMMPMLYEPDIYLTNSTALKNSGIGEGDKITYGDMKDKLDKFADSPSDKSFLDSYESSLDFFYRYINDNVDKEKKTARFNTEEFRSNAEFIKKLITKSMDSNSSNSTDSDTCVLSKGALDSETGYYSSFNYDLMSMLDRSSTDFFSQSDFLYQYADRWAEELAQVEGMSLEDAYNEVYGQIQQQIDDEYSAYMEQHKDKPVPEFVRGFTNSPDEVRGVVSCGFMVNANSKLKDKAYKFIKYSMGERMQRYITYDGADGLYNLPVNNEALKNSCEALGIQSIKYKKITKKSSYLEKYLNLVTNMNTFVINDGYYNKNVIGSIVEDYLKDKISTDSFITNLTSKTNIYLNE